MSAFVMFAPVKFALAMFDAAKIDSSHLGTGEVRSVEVRVQPELRGAQIAPLKSELSIIIWRGS